MADDDLAADNGDDASAGRVRAGLPCHCHAETGRATLYLSVPSKGKSSTDPTTIAAVAAILSSGVELLPRGDGGCCFDAEQSHEAMIE